MIFSAPDHIAVPETGERQLKHDPLLLAIMGTAGQELVAAIRALHQGVPISARRFRGPARHRCNNRLAFQEFMIYTLHGHKLRLFTLWEAQFVTGGIIYGYEA